MDLLGSLREPSTRIQREIDLQIALGGALIAAKGYAAAETGRAYARAGELCREAGDLGRLFPLLFGQWVFHIARAEHAAAQEIATEALRSANRDGDVTGLVVSHRAAGISALWCGELLEARRHLEQELALYDPERQRSLATLYAYDPRLGGLQGWLSGRCSWAIRSRAWRVVARRPTRRNGWRTPRDRPSSFTTPAW